MQPYLCPRCQSGDVDKMDETFPQSYEETTVSQLMTCLDCGQEYTNVYQLVNQLLSPRRKV
jgi:hypothetical protein